MSNEAQGSSSSVREDVIDDVVEHVQSMAKTYGFKPDADCARETVEESANLLGFELSESEAIKSCDRILSSP